MFTVYSETKNYCKSFEHFSTVIEVSNEYLSAIAGNGPISFYVINRLNQTKLVSEVVFQISVSLYSKCYIKKGNYSLSVNRVP